MQDARATFVRHGLRCTKQRLELYTALAATKEHPTAEELLWTVRRTQPGLSLATVYNTLETFCRSGLCRKLPSAGGAARYDADLRDHLHVMTTSGEVCDVPEDLATELLASLPRGLLARIGARLGVSVLRVNIEITGDRSAQDLRVRDGADGFRPDHQV